MILLEFHNKYVNNTENACDTMRIIEPISSQSGLVLSPQRLLWGQAADLGLCS